MGVDLVGAPALADLALPARVSRHRAETDEEFDASAVLIRPDGHICWAAPDRPMFGENLDRLRAALGRWFASPAAVG